MRLSNIKMAMIKLTQNKCKKNYNISTTQHILMNMHISSLIHLSHFVSTLNFSSSFIRRPKISFYIRSPQFNPSWNNNHHPSIFLHIYASNSTFRIRITDIHIQKDSREEEAYNNSKKHERIPKKKKNDGNIFTL